MPISRARSLEEFIANGRFVRIGRRFETTPVRGYVLAAGPRHFIVAIVSDRLWYDGFECIRIADLQSIEDDPHAGFADEALRRRGERRPPTPALNLASTRAILESAGALFPLVTIHREQADSEVCHIGRVVATNRSQVALLEIDPDANWDESATSYPLKDITRINFAGDYEDALFLVGGPARA